MYFPDGMTSLLQLTGEEHVGVLFINYVLAITRQGRSALRRSETMAPARINAFVEVFEKLLMLNAWMTSNRGFWQKGDATHKSAASQAIKDVMKYITEIFHRAAGQGWNLSKLHELLHATRFIDLFGAPLNYDSGPCERLHKDFAKQPAEVAEASRNIYEAGSPSVGGSPHSGCRP
jgi:hypothetical protein